MKNQYLILLSLLLLDIAGPVAQADPDAQFYIAPDGNDAWSGTLSEVNTGRNDGPLATLEGPRKAVRVRITGGLKMTFEQNNEVFQS